MKHLSLIIFCLVFSFSFVAFAQTDSEKTTDKNLPKVHILATGGTIAGAGESQTKAAYKAGEVPVEELLNAVPEIHNQAEITGEQIANIGSQDMDIKTWLKLSNRINEIFENQEADAVIITHGTDTMEETAYFLSLTVNSDKPVVLVGAMRPATAMSQDGNRNLLDAVTVAAAEKSKNIGVVVAMNEYIFSAKDVDKTHTTNTSAFQSRNFGPMGVVFDGKVEFYHQVFQKEKKIFDVSNLKTLPRVDIFYGYVDADPKIIDFAINHKAKGIVFAGVGNGNFSKEMESALAKAVEKNIQVVRSSRIGEGRVTLENEVDDEKLGFIASDYLNPQKARILLMLALTKTQDKKEIQALFLEN